MANRIGLDSVDENQFQRTVNHCALYFLTFRLCFELSRINCVLEFVVKM